MPKCRKPGLSVLRRFHRGGRQAHELQVLDALLASRRGRVSRPPSRTTVATSSVGLLGNCSARASSAGLSARAKITSSTPSTCPSAHERPGRRLGLRYEERRRTDPARGRPPSSASTWSACPARLRVVPIACDVGDLASRTCETSAARPCSTRRPSTTSRPRPPPRTPGQARRPCGHGPPEPACQITSRRYTSSALFGLSSTRSGLPLRICRPVLLRHRRRRDRGRRYPAGPRHRSTGRIMTAGPRPRIMAGWRLSSGCWAPTRLALVAVGVIIFRRRGCSSARLPRSSRATSQRTWRLNMGGLKGWSR